MSKNEPPSRSTWSMVTGPIKEAVTVSIDN